MTKACLGESATPTVLLVCDPSHLRVSALSGSGHFRKGKKNLKKFDCVLTVIQRSVILVSTVEGHNTLTEDDMKRFDLFQKDDFDGSFFPYYERTGGYTKKEADALVARMKKAGTKLTMRVHKEAK